MAQYIDKSALVAEIKKRKAINERAYMQAFLNSNDKRDSFGYKVQEDIDILSLLDTLEAKETDIEKEMDSYFNTMQVLEHENIFETTFQKIAKHFFELGLKAQKGENI